MKTILTICLSLFAIIAHAQEKKTIYDRLQGNSIGITYSGSSFNVGYKINKTENKSILFTGTNLGANFSQNGGVGLRGGLNVYFLKNHYFNDQFYIAHGWGVGAVSNTAFNSTFIGQNFSLNLGYRAEFNYNINDRFSVGVALNPSINLTANINRNFELNYGVSAGASQVGQIQCFYRM